MVIDIGRRQFCVTGTAELLLVNGFQIDRLPQLSMRYDPAQRAQQGLRHELD